MGGYLYLNKSRSHTDTGFLVRKGGKAKVFKLEDYNLLVVFWDIGLTSTSINLYPRRNTNEDLTEIAIYMALPVPPPSGSRMMELKKRSRLGVTVQ